MSVSTVSARPAFLRVDKMVTKAQKQIFLAELKNIRQAKNNIAPKIKYVVQCQLGSILPGGKICFVDCRLAADMEEAQRQQADLLGKADYWCSGVIGKTQIVPVEDSNCFRAYQAEGKA